MTPSASPAPPLRHLDDDDHDKPIVVPKPMVVAAGLLMLCTVALAAFARFSGAGRVDRPASTIAAERDIVFQQLPDDVVRVLDARTRTVIVSYPAGQGGFVRGSLRAFAYSRKVKGLALDAEPFHLTAWQNGSLSLDDPATGGRVELDAFGSENRAAFASLLRR